MKIIENPNNTSWQKILERPTKKIEDIEKTVATIFEDVKRNGNDAVKRYTNIFDGADLHDLFISEDELNECENLVSEELKNAIQTAKTNIEVFHNSQITETVVVETMPGVTCWQEKRPIEKVGLYVPGGTAPLFSTVLMLAIPAKIAGCKEIILVTPPNKKGKVHPATLYAAKLCGIKTIVKVGGIQAIAALTFGTETIPKVYKIFGPGNQYVTKAKQFATNYGIAIDMPAGPSELMVVADKSANASFIASDLLSQAEHGADSQVVLVSTNKDLVREVAKEIENQIESLSRKKIALKAIENSKLLVVNSKEAALDIINFYGPEHLILNTNNNTYFIENVSNAGSVFVGEFTPESAGDYASGTNHTLPTNGYSKAYSGITLDSFLKAISFQKISSKGLATIGSTIETLAIAEGLDAHKNAVSIRLKTLTKK